MSKSWILIACIVFLTAVGYFAYRQYYLVTASSAILFLGDTATYHVDLAEDPVKQARGLSYRDSMAKDSGMLFVFDEATPQSFWMYQMNFPLDFVWIRDGKIVGFDAYVPHPEDNGGEIARVHSNEPADMVLELNAGEIRYSKLRIGDEVRLDRIQEPNPAWGVNFPINRDASVL